jgi:hypothetical protein
MPIAIPVPMIATESASGDTLCLATAVRLPWCVTLHTGVRHGVPDLLGLHPPSEVV